MLIENWKDFVGYQGVAEPDGNISSKVLYLYKSKDGFIIIRESVDCLYTEEELCEELDKILTSFPKSNFPFSDIGKARAGNLVAQQTRRGVAKTEYKRSLFYRGESAVDTAVLVVEKAGKFGIFKHPNFEKYGFSF